MLGGCRLLNNLVTPSTAEQSKNAFYTGKRFPEIFLYFF